MLKKNNAKGYSSGRILLVDPNPENNGIVTPEDLNIYVKLSTISKERTTIVSDNSGGFSMKNSGNGNTVIFMNGSKINDEQYLTTHYTEIGTNFNDKNKDLETLGITNIKIDFNSSYAPLITINFEDVRGQLFTLGNDSPYNVFFNLPYPLFELTIKGYYGKAVTYCLHLTKFVGSFNDETGNFEIKCDFIGYTYAFLTDMLMGYLRAVPYTDIGKSVVDIKKREEVEQLNNGLIDGLNFLTFDELIDGVYNLDKELDKLKKDDVKLKALAKAENLISFLEIGRDRLRRSFNNICTVNNEKKNLNSEATLAEGIMLIDSTKFSENLISEGEKSFDITVDEFFDELTKNYSDVSLDKTLFKISNNKTKFSNDIKKSNFISSAEYSNSRTPNITEEMYYNLKVIINGLNVSNETDLTLFYIKNGLDKISELITDLKRKLSVTKEEVSNELTEAVAEAIADGSGTGVSFRPTIYNFFKILSDHVDILIQTIRTVAEESTRDRARQLENINISNIETINGYQQDKDKVYPFPEYKEVDTKVGGYVDKWIGNVAPTMPEVVFIEQLLDGLLKTRARDNDMLSQLDNGINEVLWYPINPFDTAIFTNGQNPWASVGDEGSHYDVIRLMLLRQTIFLNSHRSLSNNEIEAMAKIEARNAYGHIKNKSVRDAIKSFAGEPDANKISESILRKSLDGEQQWTNDGAVINNSQLFKITNNVTDPAFWWFNDDTTTSFYEYIYTPQIPTLTLNDVKDYANINTSKSINMALPIYNADNNYKNYNGNLLINGTNNDRIALRNNGNLFFSNYLGANSSSTNSREDDGSTFIKIIDVTDYQLMDSNIYPSYGDEIITSTNILNSDMVNIKISDKNKRQFNTNSQPSNVIPLFGGIRKSVEFVSLERNMDGISDDVISRYIRGLDKFPAWLTFYGNNNFSMVTSNRMVGSQNKKRFTPFDIREKMYDKTTGNFINNVVTGYNNKVSSIIEDWKTFNPKGFVTKGVLKTNPDTTLILMRQTDDVNGSVSNSDDVRLYEQNLLFYTRKEETDTPKVYTRFTDMQYNLLQEKVSVPYIDYFIGQTYTPNRLNDSYIGMEYPNTPYRVSLFGSDLYNSQNNESAKAFLFLHTIPFEGLNETKESSSTSIKHGLFRTVHSFFDTRAGFVEAPYSWILFLGGLLKRMKNEFVSFIHTDNTINYSLVLGQSIGKSFPDVDDYIVPFIDIPMGMMFRGASNNEGYVNIGNRIKKLPEQVKNEFIAEFDKWVSDTNGWLKLKNNLEIFKPNTKRVDRLQYWANWDQQFLSNPYNVYKSASNGGILRDGVFNDYIIIQKDKSFIWQTYVKDNIDNRLHTFLWNGNGTLNTTGVGPNALGNVFNMETTCTVQNVGSPFNFLLEIRDNSNASNNVIDFLRTTKIIANATWRIWAYDYKDGSDVIDGKLSTLVPLARFPFRVEETKFDLYNKKFFEEWINLTENDNTVEVEDELKKQLFNSINNDDIKLNLYKNIKSIYDKWISGNNDKTFKCGYVSNLISHFKFIDRAYRNIENEFKVNPSVMIQQMVRDYNQSYYEYIARILTDNNFDFIPLPSYIDYSNEQEIVNVFNSNTIIENVSSGPQFICMYIGERSSKLDLGVTSQFDNDSFDIKIADNNGTLSIDTSEFAGGAEDFMDASVEGKVPVFLVRYGKQNQSIFSNFKLDQSEFSETDESLRIIDEISVKGGPNLGSGLGQNMFDIYNTRAYSAEIKMMGNAQIQPMMYFQLYNVPMFHGAYTILKVSHDIKPNHMTTTFKGHRIRKVRTKMIDESTVFMNLIGSLSEINYSDGDLSNLSSTVSGVEQSKTYGNYQITNIPAWGGCINYQIQDNKGLKVQGGKANITNGKIKNYTIKEIGEFIENIGNKWYDYATANSFSGKILWYNDLSRRGGGLLKPHKTHQKGTSIDIRPLRNDSTVDSVTVGSSAYDREATKKFIELLLDNALTRTDIKTNSNTFIKIIYFDDDDLVQHFSNYKGYGRNMVKKIGHHADHLHVEFELPDRIVNQASTGYQDCIENINLYEVENIEKGSLSDLPPILENLGYPKGTLIHELAMAIAKKEGFGNVKPNRDRATRNNNPGNLAGVSEFKPLDSNVTLEKPTNGVTPTYAHFSNYALGTKALVEYKIKNWINGKYPPTLTNGNDDKSKAFQNKHNIPMSVRGIGGKGVKMTLEQFMYTYAPPNDNNTERYIKGIITELGNNGITIQRNVPLINYI